MFKVHAVHAVKLKLCAWHCKLWERWEDFIDDLRQVEHLLRDRMMRERFQALCIPRNMVGDIRAFKTWCISLKSLRWEQTVNFCGAAACLCVDFNYFSVCLSVCLSESVFFVFYWSLVWCLIPDLTLTLTMTMTIEWQLTLTYIDMTWHDMRMIH